MIVLKNVNFCFFVFFYSMKEKTANTSKSKSQREESQWAQIFTTLVPV